jgi:hypothetical protein
VLLWVTTISQILSKTPAGGMAFGVVGANFSPAHSNIGAGDNSWGFSCSGKKSGGGTGWTPYQRVYGEGDVIGMELDYTQGTKGRLTFYVNGENLGVAFNRVDLNVIPGVCLGGATGTRVQLIPAETATAGNIGFSTIRKSRTVNVDPSLKFCTNVDTNWGSVLLNSPAVSAGIHRWSFKVLSLLMYFGVSQLLS